MQMYTGTRLTTAIHRRLLSRFFLMEGGRLYTGYHAIYLIRLINSSRGLPKWLPSMAAITPFVSQTVRFHSQCPEGSCQVIAPSIEGKAIL